MTPRMPLFYVRASATFLVLRALSVILHYMGPSPWGGPLILSPDRFIPEALTIEVGIWAFVALFGALAESAVMRGVHTRKNTQAFRTRYRGAFLLLCCLLGIFSQIDFEVTRWLGQHMSASYIANFAGARDAKLFARILSADLLFSSFAFIQMLLALGASLWVYFRFAKETSVRAVLLSPRKSQVFYALLVLALSSPFWLRPSEKRWRRLRPASIGITEELIRSLLGGAKPHNPRRAHQDLVDFVITGRLDQGLRPKNARFPLFRDENVGKRTIAEFLALALEEKPDVIVLVFETMRGQNTGLLGDSNGPHAAMPRLRAEIAEHALYFPRMHSSGYPSVAGAMGMHLGVWPHHTRIVFSSYLHIKTIAFPEMLNAAGYRSTALLGADPSFSNFTPWFRRWYQRVEYDPKNHHDGPLVNRFIDLYDELESSPDPLLMTLWTATTHPPYDVPKESGVVPAATNEERYLQAMRYADQQLYRLVQHIKASKRFERTLIFLLGDHGQPTPWQWRQSGKIGDLSAGHTWTSLAVLGGERFLPRVGRDERAISHVDLAPTILSAIDLKHENHFFGRNLLRAGSERPVLSFRAGSLNLETGNQRTIFRIDDESSLSYEFDRESRLSYGALKGGTRRAVPPAADRERYRDMARAWSELLRDNRVAPPRKKESTANGR